MMWWAAGLWGAGGAGIKEAADYSRALRRHGAPPWKVPPPEPLPDRDARAARQRAASQPKMGYYAADVVFQVGVGFLVDAAVGLGLESRYQWAALVFLAIGAGGVLALQRATALVKLVGGPVLATLAASAAPHTPQEDGSGRQPRQVPRPEDIGGDVDAG